MVAEPQLHVAQAVQGFGLIAAGTEFTAQVQGPLAVGQAGLAIAEQGVIEADRVQRPSLPGPVAGPLE